MNFKMTKPRKLILDTLKNESKPVNAEMIFEKVNKSINLSTIYRNLELFLFQNIVSRSFLDNVAYYYINKTDHKHFMICLSCHDMLEIPCNHFENENLLGKHKDFQIVSHELTIYGYCSNCQII